MRKVFPSLLVIAFLLTGCVQLDSPKVDYKDYGINRVTTEGVEVNFYFDVTNPNPIDIEVANYSYNVYINNRKILEQTGSGFSLSSNKTKRITLPVFIRYEGVFGAALSIVESLIKGEREMEYRIEGKIQAGTMGMTVESPLKASGKIKIPSNIQIR